MERIRLALRHAGSLIALTLAFAAHAGDIVVTSPQANIAMAPGAYADVPLVFTNTGSTASAELRFVITGQYRAYAYEQRSQPECGALQASTKYSGWRDFVIAPIAAGAQRTCVVRITRGAGEIDNGYVDWFLDETDSWVYFNMGTFVDIAFTAIPISTDVDSDGITHSVFRLKARNDGHVDAANVVVGLGPTCVASPVEVDTNLPGGCADDSIGCGFTGGPAPAAKLPVIPAGGTQSCLVRLSAARDAHASVQTWLAPDSLSDASTGGMIGDLDDSNNRPLINLDVSPEGISAVGAPTLSLWMLTLLALVVLATAVRTMKKSHR